jgi:hypothetical protein
MAKQLSAQVEIDATPERVWQVLTDLGAYAEWNPFIVSSAGTPAEGERLTNRMQPVGGRAVTLRPVVIEASPERRLRWRGRMLAPGVMDAEHTFTIEPLGERRVRLTQHERFSGALVPLVAGTLDRGTLPAFELMNAALKARAERD